MFLTSDLNLLELFAWNCSGSLNLLHASAEVSVHFECTAKYTEWPVIYRKWTWASRDSLKLIHCATVREQKAAAVVLAARAPQQPIRAQKLYLHLSNWFMLFSCGISVIQKKSSGDFKELLRPPRQYLLADLVGLPPPQPRLSTSWFTRRCWSTPSLGRRRTPCRSSTARWTHSNREAPTMNQLYWRMSSKYETCF